MQDWPASNQIMNIFVKKISEKKSEPSQNSLANFQMKATIPKKTIDKSDIILDILQIAPKIRQHKNVYKRLAVLQITMRPLEKYLKTNY